MRKDLDIEAVLNQLILTYGIDRYHPRFAKREKAKQLMKIFFERYKEQNLVLLVTCRMDSAYIQEDMNLKGACKVIYYDRLDSKVMSELKNTASIIIVASFYQKEEMTHALRSAGIEAVSLYNYMELCGLELEGNYYDVFGRGYYEFYEGKSSHDYRDADLSTLFFDDRRVYETAYTDVEKELYLAKMIFDCIFAREFILAEKYIKEYIRLEFRFMEKYKEFWNQVEYLLEKARYEVLLRSRDDIIIFWLDELEYGEDRDMPFLNELSEKSMDFENAYTVTPYTSSTAKTLFCEKYLVDDKAFDIKIDKESNFIKDIESRGYRFVFYTKIKQAEDSVKGCLYQSIYTTFSEICWNMLRERLKSKEKKCMVVHEVIQTHYPWLSFGATGEQYFNKFFSESQEKGEERLKYKQMMESRLYTDKVLQFYSGFLAEESFKIYMSDHGHTELDRYHTVLRIVQKDILPEKIKGVFSYIHFARLVFRLLDRKSPVELTGKYALIQDADFYNQNHIKRHLQGCDIPVQWLLGYKGVITEKDTYIRYTDGSEKFYNNGCIGERMKPERVNYLRSLNSAFPVEIYKESKFKYSEYLHKTIQNYYQRNYKFEKRKLEGLKELFSSFKKTDVVALRGGGEHTFRIWFMLDWEFRGRISYIIDRDPACMASRLGLPVVGIDEIKEKKVSTIIISSYEYEDMWGEELRKYEKKVQIIGLYTYLRKKGIVCTRPLYKREYIKEDIVLWDEMNEGRD